MTISSGQALICIAMAAAVTYALRAGGLLLSEKIPDTGRLKSFMDALPGTILLSLVAPGILSAGFWGILASVAVVICVRKTGNLFLSMMIGVLIVAVQRNVL